MADQVAKRAAQGTQILPVCETQDETKLKYPLEDSQKITSELGPRPSVPGGRKVTEEGKLILTQAEGCEYVTNLHYITHLGTKRLIDTVKASRFYVLGLQKIAQEVVQQCKACALVNAGS